MTKRLLRASDGCLPFAILQAIVFWLEHRNELPYTHNRIEEKWFNTFLVEWGVARTVKKGENRRVLHLLNEHLREIRDSKNPGKLVDELAGELGKFGSVRRRGSNRRSRPTSLVSKVAYFLRPEDMSPLDGTALKGLKSWRKGKPHIKVSSYKTFLEAFNQEFKNTQSNIAKECGRPWTRALGERFRLESVLETRMFYRKVFDNVLMIHGGRWPAFTRAQQRVPDRRYPVRAKIRSLSAG
jgi:hypothetical protein